MPIVPFRRALSPISSEPPSATPTNHERVRHLMDRFQVLVLTRPLVAAWLLDWVERFMHNQLQ
jgi:hypothetical protein